jgi:hypothetical protein
MGTGRLPFFLAFARDWRTAADALRAGGVPDDDPAFWVWREAAWCHVRFARKQYHTALASLRATVQAVTGDSPNCITLPVTEAEAMSTAAELFDLLRIAATARYPHAFCRPAAA